MSPVCVGFVLFSHFKADWNRICWRSMLYFQHSHLYGLFSIHSLLFTFNSIVVRHKCVCLPIHFSLSSHTWDWGLSFFHTL